MVFEFTLWFSHGLGESEDGLRLMKEYNSIISRNEHLEGLEYYNSRIYVRAKSKEEIT